MANTVTIDAKLNETGVVSGAKKVKVSLEDIKKADGSLNWKGMKEGEETTKKAGDGFTVFKGILANLATVGIGMAIGAVKDFCSNIVEIGKTFETSMSKVSALSGATGDDLAALEAKARELGASTTFSASEAADALGYMALAGWDTAQMLEGVGSVLTLAQAGEMDLAAASDLVTDYLSAFNMEASDTARMVDVLAYAQSNANTTVEGLGMAFKNCAANANAAGMDIETTSAAISMMANQGLKGSEAGTALNAVLRDMTAKMQDGAIAIGDQSIAVMDAEGNYRDFIDIIADVGKATDGMGEAEKAAALQSTFTADSIKGLNLILNAGADEMDSFREQLYGCAGTAEETAAIMTDNLGGDLAAMNSAFEELSIKIYEGLQEPLRGAVQFITGPVISGLTAFAEHLDVLVPIISGVAAALGVMAIALNISSIVGAATKALTAVQGAMTGLFATMAANPVVAIIAVIAGLVVAFKTLWDNCEEFRNFWIGLWEAIQAAVQPIADWVLANVVTPMMGHFQEFQSAFSELWNAIVANVTSAWEQIAPIVQFGMEMIQTIFSSIMPVIEATWSAAWGIIQAIATAVWNVISSTVTTVMGIIQGVIQVVTGIISGDWDAVWNGIKQIFESVINGILQAGANIFNALAQIIGSVLVGIYNVWASIWNSVFNTVRSIWSSITSAISGAVSAVWNNITGTFNAMVSTVSGIFNAIQNAIIHPVETAKNILKGIIDAIRGFFNFNISWPHIPMPHFSISPPGWQIGDLLQGKIPSLGLDWYATGGMFNGPSVIGVGEAGTEFVVPRDGRHMQPFAQAVSENMSFPSPEEFAAAIVAALMAAGFGKTVLTIDGKTLGEALAPYLDQINGNRFSNAKRGLAL